MYMSPRNSERPSLAPTGSSGIGCTWRVTTSGSPNFAFFCFLFLATKNHNKPMTRTRPATPPTTPPAMAPLIDGSDVLTSCGSDVEEFSLAVVLVVSSLFPNRFLRAESAHDEGEGEALISLAVEEDRENEDRAGCSAINLLNSASKGAEYSHQTMISLPQIERHI
jgi:hypothetical protein